VPVKDLIIDLHCPYCGSALEEEERFSLERSDGTYGIVHCACYRYPVIGGIVVLRQISTLADTRNTAVHYLEIGEPDNALRCALTSMSPIPLPREKNLQVVAGLLGGKSSVFARKLADIDQSRKIRRVLDEQITFRQALSLLRPVGYSHYLFYRYANNSFLASMALLSLLKELQADSYLGGRAAGNSHTKIRVLDFPCGVGHSCFLMTNMYPHYVVTAADYDFVNLYIARRYLIPGITCVCVDAEIPLPFADNAFDAVFCLDGLHYIRSKVALLSELNRVLEPLGLWLFPHLHNASVHNVSAGIPLKRQDYLRCFEFVESRVLSEAKVLEDLVKTQTLDLSQEADGADLERVEAFTLVGSNRSDLWRRHDGISSLPWKHKAGLSINPIYRVTSNGSSLRLQMNWPNSSLEEECATIKAYLPVECEVDKSLWDRMKKGVLGAGDEVAIQRLLNSFVLVRLPREYGEFAVQENGH
jgi:SAM-dependent methyltransferase